jgi:hypothetical protein
MLSLLSSVSWVCVEKVSDGRTHCRRKLTSKEKYIGRRAGGAHRPFGVTAEPAAQPHIVAAPPHIPPRIRSNTTTTTSTMAEQTSEQTWKQPVVPDKIPTGEYPVSNWPSYPAQRPHLANTHHSSSTMTRTDLYSPKANACD